MLFPVMLTKKTKFLVNVPDLPECSATGGTEEEALEAIKAVIESQLETLIEAAQPIPKPTAIGVLRKRLGQPDGIWALVKIDDSNLRLKVVRLNITLPERVLDAVDEFARRTGETRSGLLAKAAIAFIGREDHGLPTARRGRPSQSKRTGKSQER